MRLQAESVGRMALKNRFGNIVPAGSDEFARVDLISLAKSLSIGIGGLKKTIKSWEKEVLSETLS